MQFVDLKYQYGTIKENVVDRINNVLEHGRFIMGPEVAELEAKLAGYSGVKHCISCASGTDALLLALMAYGVGPGDAIFTTPFTFIATAEVIAHLGATPVFVDIDSDTFNISAEALEKAIADLKSTNKDLIPKGIIPVDLFGLPADYDAINEIAKRNNLFVLEDAAQSFGSEYKGRKACSLGDIAATSFFPAKPLGCYGDGGAVFTDNNDVADVLRSLRVHGKGSDKYDNVRIGVNGRLDTMQAAILLAKMDIFPKEVALRQEVALRYSEKLDVCVKVPVIPNGYKSVWAQYSIVSSKKTELMNALKDAGIPVAVYYPKPLHLQTAFAYLGYKEDSMPVSERISNEIFSIPMHPYLTRDDQDKIVNAIKNV